ncbi:LemA family [Neisseria animaloris]|uniref:LemA family n=1 Tax=Neisseria animaloris TaxID=326522 RepID=A0A1X3CI22_9NEIS|nr:LemA family protein [Neisseria animaloris]MDO5073980.1 LemA family protein [Neisseria animaloris]OSI07172.1 LemA family protein [Neisseria animaloris]VEH86386.1 LemA family [Neisseria animaloris]VEJ21432.1 LemA family [Neisseria animaloris]
MGPFLALLFVIACVIFPAVLYNRLVAGRNQYLNAFAQIQVQLKRRHDLIPNLIEAAKIYLNHERATLEAVTAARSRAESLLQAAAANPNVNSLTSLGAVETELNGALRNLQVTIEAYPELKADQNISQLTEALDTAENRVAFARQAYNDSVMFYNNLRQSFPTNMLAGFFGHKQDAALLKFEDNAVIQISPRILQ